MILRSLFIFFSFVQIMHSMEKINPALVAPFIKLNSKKNKKRAELLSLIAIRWETFQNLNAPTANGKTPLQESAASDDFLDVTKIILAHKVDPNQFDNTTMSPLYIACDHLAADTVEALLNAHAKVTRLPGIHNSPLHVICDPEKDTIIRKKIDRRIRIAKSLIAHGANPKEGNSMGTDCFGYLASDPLKSFDEEALTKGDRQLLLSQRAELRKILNTKKEDLEKK